MKIENGNLGRIFFSKNSSRKMGIMTRGNEVVGYKDALLATMSPAMSCRIEIDFKSPAILRRFECVIMLPKRMDIKS